ncbi:LysM peptidoglycan-binding domain-containing protein [Cellulomonas fimi]|uniref:LysM peptidoglycan-binding domain-containing protein n=1 Tax=Cellulomonas fimi TaxID=1708 RepID=A0A7Y0QJ15_CELFI|nr:LysM peptidoglycan-binding domain-containing protein [Cellulomonas fimi]NMR21464.1 LysM peptidoglycan-binding domain-containing protein [Cellulomonas fimi]
MRLRARLVGLVATVLLIGVVVAVPAALLRVGVDLIPSELPTTVGPILAALRSPDDGTLVLQVITLVAWLAWVVLSASILLEVVARLRGARAPRIPGLHVPQLAALQLVSAAALLFVAVPSVGMNVAGAAPAHAAMAPHVVDAPVMVESREGGAGPASPVAGSTYTVQPGDSLSAIARDQLGDADRWPELVDLNPVVADDPDLIYAGTVLLLPAFVAPPALVTSPHTYTVQLGDTLSSIAARELGDAERYPEIFEANKNTVQPDGRQVTDPDVIDVGQVLTIPGTVPAVATADPAPVAVTLEPAEPAPTAIVPEPSEAPTSTYPAPEPIPAGAGQVDAPEHDDEETSTAAPWLLAGLTGGGAVLAGSLFLMRARGRHAQSRARRPGHTLPAPDVVLAPVEKTISAVGAVTAPTVEHMDAVLRRLSASIARDGATMPDLAAVELTATHVVLHLGTPTTLDEPWLGSSDGYHWRVPAAVPLDEVGPDVADQPAPYPLLATIGVGDDEAVWLLNVEDLDVSITGDPTYGLDFARYLVAEVACNPWSAGANVECIGVGYELAALNPDRVRVHEGPADDGGDPVDDALTEAVRTLDNAAAVGVDIVTARATQAGAEAWTARLILLDASTAHPALDELLDLVHAHPGRTGTCVVLNGTRPDAPGIVLDVTANGRVILASAGLDLVAVGLTSDEAQGCAALLAQSEQVDVVAVPVDDQATEGWRSFVDQSGALRDEHTLPREPLPEPNRGDAGPGVPAASSVLSEPDELYLEAAATTSEDLQTLAPRVAATVRRDVEDADPRLDEDVAAWFAESSRLPKLRLLGPVRATTRGKPLLKRKPYMTELLTFIALHPHGATPGEVADAFGLTSAKVREYVRLVREWLGTNPRTGEPHLPDARLARGALHRGTAVYEVVDLLVDLDLFRRLRGRGQARGADGIEDLRTALRLVEGRPFDAPVQRRAGGGWTWLVDGDRLDEHAVVAVVDVAHLVVTHALATGDLAAARMAAETAAMAAPFEEIPRLDLAAVATAEGRHAEAHRIIRDELANRTDDEGAPPELVARTEAILRGRAGWLGSRAS